MSILVIGNGFDIAHGLKTGYGDFISMINMIKNDQFDEADLLELLGIGEKDDPGRVLGKFIELCDIAKKNLFLSHFIRSNDIEDSWCGVEAEIEKVIYSWVRLLDNTTEYGRFKIWDAEIQFLVQSFDEFFNNNVGTARFVSADEIRCPTSYTLIDELINARGIKKNKIISKLKKELDLLIKSFELYLQLFVGTKLPNKAIDMSDINPQMVINFNYTSTHKSYGIDEANVKYIHGRIDSDPANMVMGMNVYGEEYNRDFVYFMKFFQRIQKRSDILNVADIVNAFESTMGHYLNGKNGALDDKVHFYGHSMSNADGDIIRLLKNPSNKIMTTFTIYYYDQSDYENKVINLFDVFGKDETIRMIHDEEIVFLPTSELNLEIKK